MCSLTKRVLRWLDNVRQAIANFVRHNLPDGPSFTDIDAKLNSFQVRAREKTKVVKGLRRSIVSQSFRAKHYKSGAPGKDILLVIFSVRYFMCSGLYLLFDFRYSVYFAVDLARLD